MLRLRATRALTQDVSYMYDVSSGSAQTIPRTANFFKFVDNTSLLFISGRYCGVLNANDVKTSQGLNATTQGCLDTPWVLCLSDPLGLEESGSPPCIFGIHDQSTVRTVHSLWYILLPV